MSEQTKQEKKKERAEFDIKLFDPTPFFEAFKTIGSVVEEATFNVNNQGLYFRGMDSSHVCLIDLRYDQTSFEKWDVTKEGTFGLRVDEFSKILKSLRKKESLRLTASPSEILTVKTPSSSMNLRLIESSEYDTPIPKISYNSKFSLTGKEFMRILKQISTVAQYVNIFVGDREVIFSGKGDNGDARINLEKGMPELIEIDNKEQSESKYSLEYLIDVLKHIQNHTFTVQFSEKMPMKLSAKLDKTCEIDFYLAPRIEN